MLNVLTPHIKCYKVPCTEMLTHMRVDYSVFKSNWLHVVILSSVFLYEFEVHSIDSSKIMSSFLEVSNFNQYVLKLNWFICN